MARAGAVPGELSLMDKGIGSLLEITLSSELHTINLHCNQISKIEGLGHIWNLQHLDLSSNQINQIEGLSILTNLRTLNLSCNLITKVEGLEKLHNLTKLNLSYNRIHDLTGFLDLRGTSHKISHIDLHSNCISSINHLLQCMMGLHYLTSLNLEKNGKSNPVCDTTGYREIILQTLPQLTVLDGRNVFGEPVNLTEENSSDLQCLEGLLDCSVSSSAPCHEKQVSNCSRTGTPLKVLKAKRDTDLTSESECESGKENTRKLVKRSKIPNYRKSTLSTKHHAYHLKGNITDRGEEQNFLRPKCLHSQMKENSSCVNSASETPDLEVVGKSAKNLMGRPKSQIRKTENVNSSTAEESTYRALVQELDQEKEKRWKAEQAEKKLGEYIKELQKQSKEEKDIQSMAMYTTDRLKELILRERNTKTGLQADIQQLKDETERLANELNQARNKEEDQRKALQTLEETLSKMETQRVQEQATRMKRIQEAELKASATEREVQLLRVSLRQQKEKVQQLHELLMLKEQEHRRELETRVALNGSEFQDALSKEIAKEKQRHEERVREFQEKISMLNQQYMELENEFRIALTIEAKRFKEVKDGFENVTAELAEHKCALFQSQQKEKQSAALIQELTSMVKEQKARITEVVKSKQGTTANLKSRIRALETMVEEDKQKTIQLELLKQEKSKLISQLTAQESVIDGLKVERKIWGQELAQQGASLAQDRGKLEAKIEVLTNESEILKKQNERDNDALRIKTKIVEDQTETIRKLKEGLQERDEQMRKQREENVEIQKTFQVQLDEKTAQLEELIEKLERQNLRKEELKQLLEEKEAELEDIRKAYSAMNKKWQDKGELLSHLETQVKQMKENFDIKEKKLIEERNQSLQTQKVAMEKLHSVDDAFRRQLESTLAAHQAELLQLANEKQRQIEAANEKVYQVEEEMRQLLQETANSKKTMEEKIRRLTSALSDIQQDL
ncbi:leucine-rich repeat and coiled-coil domain-containing protein 1 isoform X2 [Dermochelys coriacea]|uniref:leucine-rich repeat and coiled-coil domain-containing protein 1 isoform X2 n=1 Tax=Dermochelys coriacea TaxID=27794 RepID=UPI0018E8C991|nr:leucine-rich repeat and coiled-coil domain-containing protein 1 isoform X2 [Dermochelys coriacea]